MATHASGDHGQDLFEDVGKKVETLQLESKEADTNSTVDTKEDERVVDEIESLCMNCQENVCTGLYLTTARELI